MLGQNVSMHTYGPVLVLWRSISCSDRVAGTTYPLRRIRRQSCTNSPAIFLQEAQQHLYQSGKGIEQRLRGTLYGTLGHWDPL